MKVELEGSVDPNGVTYWSLTLGREYVVLGIEADWYRILDNTGDPVLFDPSCFAVTDPTEPAFWQSSIGDNDERYAYLPPWNRAGFFEDYHDRIESVQIQFLEDLKRYYPSVSAGI